MCLWVYRLLTEELKTVIALPSEESQSSLWCVSSGTQLLLKQKSTWDYRNKALTHDRVVTTQFQALREEIILMHADWDMNFYTHLSSTSLLFWGLTHAYYIKVFSAYCKVVTIQLLFLPWPVIRIIKHWRKCSKSCSTTATGSSTDFQRTDHSF